MKNLFSSNKKKKTIFLYIFGFSGNPNLNDFIDFLFPYFQLFPLFPVLYRKTILIFSCFIPENNFDFFPQFFSFFIFSEVFPGFFFRFFPGVFLIRYSSLKPFLQLFFPFQLLEHFLVCFFS